MKRSAVVFLLFASFLTQEVSAQMGETAYTFLTLPTSPHISSLGGYNVSVVSSDNDFALQNPSLLREEHDMKLNINYTNLVADIFGGNAFFSKQLGKDGGTIGVGVNLLSYGRFKQTTPDGIEVGSFSASDLAFIATYSYQLSSYWRGGISGKLIYSPYEQYTSWGAAFDVGLNYYNPQTNFSGGVVVKNFGGVISNYTDKEMKMPWDIQAGFSYRLAHAPFRFSLTAIYLNKWNLSTSDGSLDKPNFFLNAAKHFVVGVDFVPNKSFYLSAGFNPKIQTDFAFTDFSGFYGLSFGGGIQIKRFSIAFSYNSYHVNASRFQIGLTTSF